MAPPSSIYAAHGAALGHWSMNETRAEGRYRVGIDIGGTFTDVVLFDQQSGILHLTKVPTVPSDPAAGFLFGLDRVSSHERIAGGALGFVGHGTTVATNTIIEGTGAKVGLLTSEGFSDVLEIAYQTRPNQFDLMYDKPRPLVPRRRTLGVPERIGPDGQMLTPLDEAAAVAAARRLVAMGAEVVVIAFLHAYRFPDHERRAAAAIGQAIPALPIVLSSDVCPEYREYPRTSTAVVNALLLPRVGKYVARLNRELSARKIPTGMHLMTSSGGVLAGRMAARHPVQLIESGPAATALGAAYVAGLAGFRDCIVFDMGGTTAKVALIPDGQPRVSDQFEVGAMAMATDTAARGRGYPVRTPSVEMVEVGAGGGSIAALDPGGALVVGPQSAGADPGPACYAQNGDRPTITDANVVLGRLNPIFFLGGEKRLDVQRAHDVIARDVAAPLALTVPQAAAAIIEIAVARMAAALRMATVRRGIDPRKFMLVACGGAGPLHAAAIAARLGMAQILIPPAPGLTSALGLLATDLRHDLVRQLMVRTADADPHEIEGHLRGLQRQGGALLAEQSVAPADISHRRLAEMCYVGQAFSLRLSLPGDGAVDGSALADLVRRFHAAHKAAYGFANDAEPTMIAAIRVTSLGAIKRPLLREVDAGGADPCAARKGERPVVFDAASDAASCAVYRRTDLKAGNRLQGPVVIEQLDTTTLLPPGAYADVDRLGNLIITLAGR